MSFRNIHLIGICGTAMAALAGMLRQKGYQITGSDAAAYPPMSDFLAQLGIVVRQPYSENNLEPRPDLVIVGNAISRGNPELEYVLDTRIPFQSLPHLLHDEFLAPGTDSDCRYTRQDDRHLDAELDFPHCGTGALFFGGRNCREFRQ
jgi:UDP-N-acetylmuramate: L-alanyl-gamma-D-glutamyl-meso-diaminopimelate ligase